MRRAYVLGRGDTLLNMCVAKPSYSGLQCFTRNLVKSSLAWCLRAALPIYVAQYTTELPPMVVTTLYIELPPMVTVQRLRTFSELEPSPPAPSHNARRFDVKANGAFRCTGTPVSAGNGKKQNKFPLPALLPPPRALVSMVAADAQVGA